LPEELKLIVHDDGLLTLLDDPTWVREYRPLRNRNMALMVLSLLVGTGIGVGILGAIGLVADVAAPIAFALSALLAFPLAVVQMRASLSLHIGRVGLTTTRVFGQKVRISEVMDGVARQKPAPLSPSSEPTRILWEDVDDVIWSDVHLEVRHHGDQAVRFDLEDYARADIARLGEEIRKVWEASEPSRAEPEEAEASKEQLQRLAKGRAEQRQG